MSDSKKTIQAKLMSECEGMFRCPICFMPMKMDQLRSLICTNRHCFDVSRQGYLNFLNRSPKTKYDKRLFQARQTMCQNGFFEPLIEQISRRIKQESGTKKQRIRILDAGCGEGSLLSGIREKVSPHTANGLLSVGVDISKEGILAASKAYSDSIWCVADLAKCPFANQQFDFILNTLSPSNYSEFNRMLANDGTVIKVIPEKNYLKEVREVFYGHTNRPDYSNEGTVKHFADHFDLLDMEHVRYRVALDRTLIGHLVRMTPLSWGATEERLQKMLDMDSAEITVELTILIGKKFT